MMDRLLAALSLGAFLDRGRTALALNLTSPGEARQWPLAPPAHSKAP